MKAFALIQIRTGSIHEVVSFLKRTDHVSEAYAIFGPYDAIAVIEGEDLNQIADTIYRDIQSIPGVEQTLTCLSVSMDD
ncbi:MAG: Lrp/AsnC family transcriptional regulator [Caldilineae bacterium]|nr:MAG: Lrp/AsnC family transcriptional regulator [Caldilineae bacterium]